MAFHHSPKIVTSGLQIALDAKNPKSYPGSGNTWFDLSGKNNHAVKNGNAANPTYSGEGFFTFGATALGVNNGFLISDSATIRNLNEMTVELVFTLQTKSVISGDSDWMAIFSKDNGSRSNQIPAISINQGTSANRFLHIERTSAFNSAANTFTDYTGNKWYHVTATISSSGNISKGYLNSVEVSSAAGGMTGNTNPIYLGTDSGSELFKGKLAIVRMYNRALTLLELQQNFEATRGRFGL